jgi:transcriptional regulator with XRE-family HTH domain
MPSVTPLAARLRALRIGGWPGRKLTQLQLGRALDVSVPLISSWEKDTLPPDHRLDAYARLFAAKRSTPDGKLLLLEADQLNDAESAAFLELRRELFALRPEAGGPDEPAAIPEWSSPLQFPPGQAITIVCSELPPERRAAFGNAHPRNADYIESYKYADLDALIELLPAVVTLNPTSPIAVGTVGELSTDDLTAHLIALGGVDWNAVTEAALSDLWEVPVSQFRRGTDEDTGGFSVRTPQGRRKLEPKIRRERGNATLVEDVAHFLRVPNPYNRQRTLTVFNGMYSRGSYGVVRALTDPKIQERNARYVARRFPDAETYSIVCRVKIVANEVVVPDWTVADVRLHEWPEAVN